MALLIVIETDPEMALTFPTLTLNQLSDHGDEDSVPDALLKTRWSQTRMTKPV
jgi:hypothetical protein